jgi:hypothetical protein
VLRPRLGPSAPQPQLLHALLGADDTSEHTLQTHQRDDRHAVQSHPHPLPRAPPEHAVHTLAALLQQQQLAAQLQTLMAHQQQAPLAQRFELKLQPPPMPLPTHLGAPLPPQLAVQAAPQVSSGGRPPTAPTGAGSAGDTRAQSAGLQVLAAADSGGGWR